MLPDLRFFVGAALLAALAGMAGLGLFAVAHLQTKLGPLEASRNRAFADHAEWNQFYDADSVRRFVGLGRKAEMAQPADAAPENRGEDINRAPVASAVLPTDSSGGHREAASVPAASPAAEPGAIAAVPALEPASAAAPPAPEQPREIPNTATPLPAMAALPDRFDDHGTNAAIPSEPTWDQEPWDTTPAITTSQTTTPGGADPDARGPALPPEPKGAESAPRMPPSAAPPTSTARAKAATPLPPVRIGAPVRNAAPESEPEPERSRPASPPRARAALPGQQSTLQREGAQWVDPQHFGAPQPQFGGQPYAPPQYSSQPPGSPQFGPYFPYGPQQPTAQRSRPQQYRAPQQYSAPQYYSAPAYDPRQFAPQPYALQQMTPRQPAPDQSFNSPYGWR